MELDLQLVIVSLAAGAASVYAIRRVLLQFRRPDDEAGACHGCPANPVGRVRTRRRGDVR